MSDPQNQPQPQSDAAVLTDEEAKFDQMMREAIDEVWKDADISDIRVPDTEELFAFDPEKVRAEEAKYDRMMEAAIDKAHAEHPLK